ncbi:MAG: hypothetical protein FD129_265 [bacterium]|nr:MAG: hypothetical protein FD129_265 [bacterium]
MSTRIDWSRTCISCQYCCTYVSLAIDAPKTEADLDHIRWYLAHRNIQIYIGHEDDWYFLVNNVCENLTADGCAIYEDRFEICRDYSAATCEMTTGEPAEKVLFRTVDDFDRWLERNRERVNARLAAARAGASPPAPTDRTIRGHLKSRGR